MKPLSDYDQLIFVATMGRNGSRMFINLLNSVSTINMKFEPTIHNCPPSDGTPLEDFESFVTDTDETYDIIGCKFFIQQSKRFDLTREYLMSLNDNVKIIHLCRENILDQFISLRLAQANNSWFNKDKDKITYTIDTLHIDINDFERYEEYTLKSIEEFKKMYGDDLYITYDELSTNPQKTFDDKIFNHLEMDSCPVEFKTFRQNMKPKEECIENFDQILKSINKYML